MFYLYIKVEQSSIHLPTLPLPDLHPTLDKYLLCVKPLVSDIQFEKTKKIVEKFGQPGGVGEKLQNQLQKYATTQENWVIKNIVFLILVA